MEISEFQALVWDYYTRQGRSLPWREPDEHGNLDPYQILVSEIMLQQTQVNRVMPKFQEFLNKFQDVQKLANAPLASVLSAWSGLGYNRRAKFLHEAAKQLANTPQPWTLETLVACKGIGPNTAAAVLVYAYNEPLVFIETNIRTVFIQHFFADQTVISDKALWPLVEQALDHEQPREWYWALMDYGVYLKTTIGNLSQRSVHYAKQSTFAGSRRQVRGQVLRLLNHRNISGEELARLIPDERLGSVLADLLQEKLVTQSHDVFHLG